MDSENFRTLGRQRPFVPFRVKTSTGQAFDAVHPELLLVCSKHMIIGFPRKGSDKPIFETFERVYYSEITQVEMLDAGMALQTT